MEMIVENRLHTGASMAVAENTPGHDCDPSRESPGVEHVAKRIYRFVVSTRRMSSSSVLGIAPLQSDATTGVSVVFLLILLALTAVIIAGGWKMLAKAGEPGWGVIVPIYNTYLFFKIGGNSGWWLLALFVPLVNLYALYRMSSGISEAFGQGAGFTVGLFLLPGIFHAILGFGDYRYRGRPN